MTSQPTPPARWWLAAAAVLGQLAAATAGVLPAPLLPVTVAGTVVAARMTRPPGSRWARIAPLLAVGAGLFAAVQAGANRGTVTSDGLSAPLQTLTITLVLLCAILVPTWHRVRELRLWLGMSAAVLLAAAAAARTPTDGAVLIAGWVVLLCAAWRLQSAALRSQAAAVAAVASAERPPSITRRTLRRVPAPVVGSVVAGALVFLALPGGLGGGNLPARIASYVHPAQEPGLTRSILGIDTMGTGILDLRVRGKLPTTPILRVPLDSPPLWRGSVYTSYTGSGWQELDEQGSFALIHGSNVAIPPTANDPRPRGKARTDTAHIETTAPSALVWAPGAVTRVRADMRGVLQASASLRFFGRPRVLDYTVSTIVPITAPAVLLESTGIDDIGPAWTQLPAALPDRVVQLARRITAKAASREAQVTAVTSYLRSHETYSLDSPVPGVNEDAVDRFLFRDHVGFCEQFASAAVVLVRAVGVPARVVTGLAYGHQVGTGRLYTAADAHAWVEVHYPGVGWSPIDPTAGVALATATGSGSGRWAWLHRLTTSVPAGLPGATTIVALLAAGAVVATRRRRLHSAPAGDAIDSGPVLAAFRRYVRWRRQPRQLSETAREYVERLKATDQLRDAVTILEHECYGAMSPVDSETARAVAAFTDSSGNR